MTNDPVPADKHPASDEPTPRGEASNGFEGDSDPGLSLDELSEAYASLIEDGNADDPFDAARRDEHVDSSAELFEEIPQDPTDADAGCQISPRTILEAMLFVGHPENHPLTSRQVAAMMRGVSPREIDQLVEELNWTYETEGAPYQIASVDSGYQLQLRDGYESIRDRFFGRVKAAKLSQPALDVLAIVAYHQGITREHVDKLRTAASASLLRQLVRRELLRLERPDEKPRTPQYYTTDRFLDLVGIESLDDLPQSE